ncbi:hypothetical protein ACHAPU_003244 [Fusarium lateritium]
MTRLDSGTEGESSSNPNLGSHGTDFNTTMYPSIAEFLVKRDFGDDMQDALAIVWFPPLNVSSDADIETLMEQVPVTMHHWAGKSLPDPYTGMGTACQDTMYKLEKLHRCILRYIQDYMTKATSNFLPRAYSSLPDLLFLDGTDFRDRKLEGDFDLACLSTSDRKRLFWAFLRYELMSKIRLYKSVAHRIYAAPNELNMRGGHLFWPWESEALLCVQTYVSTLYEAFLSEWQETITHMASPPVLAPDTELDNRTVFETTHSLDYRHPQRGDINWGVTKFSEYGFDLISHLIVDAMSPYDDDILQRRIAAFIQNVKYDNYGEVHRRGYVRHPRCYKAGDERIPVLYWQVASKKESYTIEGKCVEMYRQRAWPFFDDPKVHAQRSAFFPWFITEPVVKSWRVLRP